MANQTRSWAKVRVVIRLVLCALILLAGAGAMALFSAKKKKPHRSRPKEMALQVTVQEAIPMTVRTRLRGFGTAAPVTSVRLAAEVGGRIVQTHPDFDQGKTVAKDDILFQIDPSDYQTSAETLRAGLAEKQAGLSRIQKEFGADRKRLATLVRSQNLARAEYDRVRVLLEENSIGNRSAVDQAEQNMNTAIDRVDQLKRSLSLYPVRIQEIRAQIASKQAQLAKAEVNLARTIVRAPFSGRIKSVAMELGEYAAPGREVVTLADDRVLEIQVSLDARDVSAWLVFDTNHPIANGFPMPMPVDCAVSWIEAPAREWTGILDRIVDFHKASRTYTLAVRVARASCQGCPALVDGMFCRVSVPGRELGGVFRLKRWLVTTDNTVYAAKNGRLLTRSVNRVYADGDDIYLTGEIQPKDLLITTRLVDPLEHSALKIMNRPGQAPAAGPTAVAQPGAKEQE